MGDLEKLRKREAKKKRAEEQLENLRKEVHNDMQYLRESDEKNIDTLIAALEADRTKKNFPAVALIATQKLIIEEKAKRGIQHIIQIEIESDSDDDVDDGACSNNNNNNELDGLGLEELSEKRLDIKTELVKIEASSGVNLNERLNGNENVNVAPAADNVLDILHKFFQENMKQSRLIPSTSDQIQRKGDGSRPFPEKSIGKALTPPLSPLLAMKDKPRLEMTAQRSKKLQERSHSNSSTKNGITIQPATTTSSLSSGIFPAKDKDSLDGYSEISSDEENLSEATTVDFEEHLKNNQILKGFNENKTSSASYAIASNSTQPQRLHDQSVPAISDSFVRPREPIKPPLPIVAHRPSNSGNSPIGSNYTSPNSTANHRTNQVNPIKLIGGTSNLAKYKSQANPSSTTTSLRMSQSNSIHTAGTNLNGTNRKSMVDANTHRTSRWNETNSSSENSKASTPSTIDSYRTLGKQITSPSISSTKENKKVTPPNSSPIQLSNRIKAAYGDRGKDMSKVAATSPTNANKVIQFDSNKIPNDPLKYALPILPKIPPTTNGAIKRLVNKNALNASQTSTNNIVDIKKPTNMSSAKQPSVLDDIPRTKSTQLVDYDSSSMSSNSSSNSNAKSRGSDTQKNRSTVPTPETAKKCSGPTSKKVKQHGSSKVPVNTDDGKIKKNRSKCDTARPSTSKQNSTDSEQRTTSDRERSIRRAVREINGSLSDSDVRKLTAEFVERIKNYPKKVTTPMNSVSQTTQTDTSQALSTIDCASEKTVCGHTKEKSNRIKKRNHDVNNESTELNRELDELLDPDSFHYVPGPLPKRRRKSVLQYPTDADCLESLETVTNFVAVQPSNGTSAASSITASTSKTIWHENNDSRYSNATHSIDAIEIDDDNLLTPMPIIKNTNGHKAPKNIDPLIYFEDPKHKVCCVVCEKRMDERHTTSHYVRCHPNLEVYTSRFSPNCAEMAVKEPASPHYENATKTSKMLAMCYFCGRERSFYPQYWVSHILSHTGEYQIECETCNQKLVQENYHRKHCISYKPRKLFQFQMTDGYLWAFMCRSCNYVQVRRENMESHLTNEHAFHDETLHPYYCRIKLISNRVCAPIAHVKKEISGMDEEEDQNASYSSNSSAAESSNEIGIEPATATVQSSPKVEAPKFTLKIKTELNRSVDEDANIGFARLDETEEILSNSVCERLAQEPDSDVAQETMAAISSAGIRKIKAERFDASSHPNEIDNERYLALFNCYMADDDTQKVPLKPWLQKHDTDDVAMGVEDQLRSITLYALYKCMAKNCIFSTNDAEKISTHMADHEKLVQFYMRTKKIVHLSRRLKSGWLECAYCSYIADSRFSIVDHTKREHASSPFQCSHCFYRTIEIANMHSHIVLHHALEDNISILLCEAQPKWVNTERMELLENRVKYVVPFECNHGGVQKKFYLMEHFQAHLKKLKTEKYSCNQCKLSVPIQKALKHLECHGLKMFHCLHCQYGAPNIDDLRHHMGENHPSKLLYLSARKFLDSPYNRRREDDVNATVIVDVVGAMETHYEISPCPYTEAEINFMETELFRGIKNKRTPPTSKTAHSPNIGELLTTYRLKKSENVFLTLKDFEDRIQNSN